MFFVIYRIALMDAANLNTCPETFIYFENYCYYFASEKQNFTTAEETCNNYSLSQSNPCHLTSIHSAGEDAFVRANAQRRWVEKSFWLGATIREGSMQKDDLYAQYSWLDGSPMNFVKFKHEPHPGTRICLQWKHPGWNGAKCSLFKKYVCKTVPQYCKYTNLGRFTVKPFTRKNGILNAHGRSQREA
ncbi:Collectin-12 [Holothuria leucospilota]|uniref:Collectin-12 n=1 Tax=Holothuria leucospilota TaxID=206669 RepID=A0A9Q1C234_HOLLE|nr:Collectin-12 [Holothuria leucospilota]